MTYYPPKNQAKLKQHGYIMTRDRLMAVKLVNDLMAIEVDEWPVLKRIRQHIFNGLPEYPGAESDRLWLWQAINDPAYRVTGAHPSVPWSRHAE